MAVGLMAAGTVIGALGALKEGQSASEAGKYNAKTATANAQAAREMATLEGAQQRMLAFKTVGAMRANFASSGLAKTGSVEDVLADSMANAELDNMIIKYRGEAAARGYTSQAQLSNMQASAAKSGSYWSAAGTLLGGGAMTYDVYNRTN